MVSQSDRNLTIEAIDESASSHSKGFYVKSTAPINVEDDLIQVEKSFEDVKDDIVTVLLNSPDPQINIYVHGYSVRHEQAKSRAEQLFRASQSHAAGQLVLGFLWPSENPGRDNSQLKAKYPVLQKISYALESLPTVLLIALFSSLLLGLTAWGLLLIPSLSFTLASAGLLAALIAILSVGLLALSKATHLFSLTIVHGISAVALFWLMQTAIGPTILLIVSDVMTLLFGMIFGLIILRLVTYLRDRERASYFAVYDLVELIRKLDKAIWEAGKEQGATDWKLDSELKKGAQGRPRVELNIMAHSLGCMVVTNAIRILSDVFDPDAVQKTPNSKLGQTLSLERLVLAAPDIPIESVLPGRSNFLTSSLKRCAEPYVFTNEGDLALRLASTAANYVSYFSRERFGGYRLGNITCRRDSKMIQYGIMNREKEVHPHQILDVRSSKKEQETLMEVYKKRCQTSRESWNGAIADKITYFDCTDYQDKRRRGGGVSQNNGPILTQAKGRLALNFIDYCRLIIKYLVTKKIDTHGGYFEGRLSQELLHELTLSGFQQYLARHHGSSLETFNDALTQKQIQAVVSDQFSKKFCLTRPKRKV